jgi:ribose-phosphate pyrophosphokinase
LLFIKIKKMNQKAFLFSTRASLELSKKIASYYNQDLGIINLAEFKDGEYEPCFEESIRGARVFLIGSTYPPADHLMELLLMCDAAKRASAKNITAVIPYFGWARQDRKDKPRAPIGAKLVVKLLETAGATRVITLDLHADQIQGFFEIPVDHLYGASIFIDYIKKLNLDSIAIASPDMGGAKRARSYASYLQSSEVVICYKERKKANEIEYMTLIGKVKGRNVILVDDLVDTASTLTKAAELIKNKGAKSIRAICTHGLLSEDAYEKIENSLLEELIIMDTIPLKKNNFSKIKILSCASLLAEVMHLIHDNKSISSKFVI